MEYRTTKTASPEGGGKDTMNKDLLKIHEIYYNDETKIVTIKTPSNGDYEIPKSEFLIAQYNYKKGAKSTVSAYVLWFLLGILGAHRFYVGDYLRGGLLLITLGGFIIGWLADCALLKKRVDEYNEDLEAEVLVNAIEATLKNVEQQAKQSSETKVTG